MKDATADEDTIRAWWARWPEANVALACGPESGVHVVDVDVDPSKGVDGWESLKAFPELPATVRQDSPRGGAHFFFRADTPPRNKNSFRPGIDIRSGGYYVLLPPSIHPNGKAYAWTRDYGPDEIEMAEFPEFMRPAEERSIPPWERHREPPAPKPEPEPAKTTAKAPSRPAGTPVLERASLYLQECEPAVQGQAGHDKLMWAARALVVGFELDEGTALRMLWDEFNPRCVPPWNREKAADRKDFDRKVAEARRTPGQKPAGWLLDEYGLRGGGEESVIAYGRTLAEGLLAGVQAAPEPAPAPEPAARPAFLAGNPKRKKPEPPGQEWPDWILRPPGMVGQIAEWISATAGCPQPRLALGCALTACGALFGRKVRDQSNGRTNIYMMGVAHSSAGKDHPADCVERLFAASGASNLIGGSRVTSDSALELALVANPVQFFPWDEVGHMLSAIKQAGVGSGGAQHLRTIVPALMQLYSSPHKLYVGKQRADEDVRRIDQPHVCVWGLTSPDVLFAGLSTAELRDGWLGRVVTIISHDRPKYQIKDFALPPEHLIALTQAWATRTIPTPEGMGDLRGAMSAHQIIVPAQPDALAVFEAFRDECHARMIECDRLGDDTQYLWGKALQNSRRVSLTVATGERYDGAEITEFHAQYGCELIRRCIEAFAAAIKHNLADNQWEADKQRIYKAIERGGRDGLSRSELTRRTQFVRDKKVRDSYLADLAEAGMIDLGAKGKAAWLWKHPYGMILNGEAQ